MRGKRIKGGDTVQIIDHQDLPRQFANENWLGRIGTVYVVYDSTYPARVTIPKPRYNKHGMRLPFRQIAIVDFRRRGQTMQTITRAVPVEALERLD
jgi:hypothetical protein